MALLLVLLTLSSSSLCLFGMSMTATSPPKHVVVVGGGIQGVSVAYHCCVVKDEEGGSSSRDDVRVTVLEAVEPAAHASGKGGGFMARSWGDGTPTQSLHHGAFDMYRDLAEELECASYRTLPVLGVGAGRGGVEAAQKQAGLRHLLPSWLDGATGRISPMGTGDDTAQITPSEFVEKMLRAVANRVTVVRGTCVGVVTTAGDNGKQVAAVKYKQDDGDDDDQVQTLPADAVCVSAGPWSCQAEQWFDGAVQLPMEGIKSTSIVWKEPEAGQKPDATALFCGENAKYGTHLEVYPRPDGTIYICGVGGSDYISTTDLQSGAFLRDCPPVEARVEAAVNAFQEMSATYAAAGELERTQACMRPCPPDAMPYMGPVPGVAGAYINAGHNCWGIAWAPACGKAMAELILQGKSTSIDLSPFDPARFTQKRTGRGRKKKGASVGEQW